MKRIALSTLILLLAIGTVSADKKKSKKSYYDFDEDFDDSDDE